MQEKTTSVAATSAALGLNIHKSKSKILRYNTTSANRITLDGEYLEDVKTVTYLASIIDEHGGSDTDVKERIGKARAVYLQLKNIWNSEQLSTNSKVRIFNTNVKTVLLYEAETWRTTKAIIHKIQVKSNNVAASPASVGVNIHKGKSSNFKYNMKNNNPITHDGENQGELKTSTYLIRIINEQGGSDANVKARISKARTAIIQLNSICNSNQPSSNIKITIFNMIVETVLL
ncbi:unnamed protein product [Schistosoma curassoni]|uniref:DUF6451 domain-containing protein n=1 Tax=Schistosoma curassoni TaxID=6186 RepID=A0A183K4V9_9TREM|nr:unnamed protein product [Schistosoma curassoni]